MQPLETVLAKAIALLRKLPRDREAVAEAYTLLNELRGAYPGIRMDLLVDLPPGSAEVDYDFLLEHPEGGTLALNWRADEGTPWAVEYADHHAANYVVTVNDEPVTVQQALLLLRLMEQQRPGLMDEMIDAQLINQAIRKEPPPVSAGELQRAADAFRTAHGLTRAEAFWRWLDTMGLSMKRFESVMEWIVQREKLQERITEDDIEVYFYSNQNSLERVKVFRVELPDQVLASRLVKMAGERDLVQAACMHLAQGAVLTASLENCTAANLPDELINVSTGSLAGPVAGESTFWIAQVLRREPPQLDLTTRRFIRERLFDQWLDELRQKATVRWHWL